MKKRAVSFLIVLAVMLCVALAVLLVPGRLENTPAVILPDTSASPDSALPGGQTGQGGTANRAEVTPETVQAVISTLSRPLFYSREIAVTTFWSGGSSSGNISLWISGDSARITDNTGKSEKNVLIIGEDVWLWYTDIAGEYGGSVGEAATAADEYSRILTYEELLSVDVDSISGAGYTLYDDQPCIYAEYTRGAFGYRYELYVSVETGLPVAVTGYDGDSVIYSMTSVSTDISTPPDEVFQLP